MLKYVKGNSWVSYQELTATKESFGNDSSWQYTVTMKAKPMLELFNHRGKQPRDGGCPYVAIRQGFLSDSPKFYFGVSQDDNNLENAQIACGGGFKMAPGDNAEYYGISMDKKKMTITRTYSVTYEIEHNDESSDGET